MEMYFRAYGRPLEAVSEFKYLGRLLTASDYDWPEVVGNLRKAQMWWLRMSRILGLGLACPRKYGKFYKSVVKEALLFKENIWVISPRIGRTLGGFHHRVDFRMENIQPRG